MSDDEVPQIVDRIEERICPQCGQDREPEALAHDGLGVRFLLNCESCGHSTLVDPFIHHRDDPVP